MILCCAQRDIFLTRVKKRGFQEIVKPSVRSSKGFYPRRTTVANSPQVRSPESPVPRPKGGNLVTGPESWGTSRGAIRKFLRRSKVSRKLPVSPRRDVAPDSSSPVTRKVRRGRRFSGNEILREPCRYAVTIVNGLTEVCRVPGRWILAVSEGRRRFAWGSNGPAVPTNRRNRSRRAARRCRHDSIARNDSRSRGWCVGHACRRRRSRTSTRLLLPC